ncbi:hypothetical protein AAFC00_005950 [Neodothiora populina]|uniref:Uncharacterized protein n=1 Tax=Neodothiora populina TaxID=2781224 RepID=A0ABR3P767_9PEZI
MASSQDLLGRLQRHLDELKSDPSIEIDTRLIESCSLALPQTIPKNESIAIIKQVSEVLPTLQNDPTPVISLLLQLLEPYTFSDILSLDAGGDFVAGLHVQALPYNRLMLAILNKAATNATDAATIAAKPEVVAALVQLWLCTQDAGVAQESGRTLTALLKADYKSPPGSGQEPTSAHNQGLMWKRVFGDQDISALIFSTCSLKSSDESLGLSKSQKTLAQARLLEWLPEIGHLNWNAIAKGHHPNIESKYMDSKGAGLLYFAAACMVDIKVDVLMHRCLIDFFADLIQKIQDVDQARSARSSVSLDFLMTHGLHDTALSYYLDPESPHHDPLDLQFVYAPSANYLAAYASTYPSHFLDSSVKGKTLERLRQSLDLSPSRWAHAESPKHDLHILASLPRLALLPTQADARWMSSPLALLPSKSTNPDVLNTLAVVFRGPSRDEVYPSPTAHSMAGSTQKQDEAQAARMLYYLYLNYNPKLFEDLVKHADTIALESQALAALNVISSVATANWSQSPKSSDDNTATLTEAKFLTHLPQSPTATPPYGSLALLAPPSLEHTLPYLLKPPQTFSNIVGGLGDTQNPAYRVAMAKFEALVALCSRLSDHVTKEPEQGYEEIVETLRKRMSEGPWPQQGQVGSSIATMEL